MTFQWVFLSKLDCKTSRSSWIILTFFTCPYDAAESNHFDEDTCNTCWLQLSVTTITLCKCTSNKFTVVEFWPGLDIWQTVLNINTSQAHTDRYTAHITCLCALAETDRWPFGYIWRLIKGANPSTSWRSTRALCKGGSTSITTLRFRSGSRLDSVTLWQWFTFRDCSFGQYSARVLWAQHAKDLMDGCTSEVVGWHKVSWIMLENKIWYTWWTDSWPAGNLSGPAAPGPCSSWPPPPPTRQWRWRWLPKIETSASNTSWPGSRWRRPWAGGRRWGRSTAAPRSGQPGCAGTGCPPTRSAPGRGAGGVCSSRTRPPGSGGWAKHTRSCPLSADAGSGW